MHIVRSPTWLGAAQICPKAWAAHLARETAGIVPVSPPLRAGTAPWAQPCSACGSAARRLLLGSSFASLEEIITLHWLKNALPLLTHPLPSFGSFPKADRESRRGALLWSSPWEQLWASPKTCHILPLLMALNEGKKERQMETKCF